MFVFKQTAQSGMMLTRWEPSRPTFARLGPTGTYCGADPAEQSFGPHQSHPVKGFQARFQARIPDAEPAS